MIETWSTEDWREPDDSHHVGIELSAEESVALWNYLQHKDAPPYWDDPVLAHLANKAKMFHKYGPWDDSEAVIEGRA